MKLFGWWKPQREKQVAADKAHKDLVAQMKAEIAMHDTNLGILKIIIEHNEKGEE